MKLALSIVGLVTLGVVSAKDIDELCIESFGTACQNDIQKWLLASAQLPEGKTIDDQMDCYKNAKKDECDLDKCEWHEAPEIVPDGAITDLTSTFGTGWCHLKGMDIPLTGVFVSTLNEINEGKKNSRKTNLPDMHFTELVQCLTLYKDEASCTEGKTLLGAACGFCELDKKYGWGEKAGLCLPKDLLALKPDGSQTICDMTKITPTYLRSLQSDSSLGANSPSSSTHKGAAATQMTQFAVFATSVLLLSIHAL